MRIGELFRMDPRRDIAEVIKVTSDEDATVSAEIDEYVVTQHLREQLEEVVETYRDTIDNPSENTNVWVSGFFGSGKSSFAKVLGYLLANPVLGGRSAAERILDRVDRPETLRALLDIVHGRGRTLSVYLDLSSGIDVLGGGTESVVLPLYRQLLDRLGYSRNETLAELEVKLEGEGRLAAFEKAFEEVSDGRRWVDERGTALARSRASAALCLLEPATFPSPDSWARAVDRPEVTARWFADRALFLLARRGQGARRIAFIVDEVGQYVARDRKKMLDLQGVAEQLQRHKGALWMVATSQERLDDVMDALEKKKTELARVQDRFPIRVDLLPSDIHEVAGKRVLDKNEAGQRAVRELLQAHRHKLAATTRLDAPGRDSAFTEDEAVRLYPLLPHHVELLIDAVSARRQGPTAGGSNRTIIKLAQQLLVDPRHGLLEEEVGALATIDRAAHLLHAVVPPSLQAEVEHVADRHGAASPEAALLHVVALCFDTPRLPLTAANLAALTHPSVPGDSRLPMVQAALDVLVDEDRLRRDEGLYGLQSPEQKDWEKARRAKELTPAAAARLRRRLVAEALTGLTVTASRSFKVGLVVDDEKAADGEVVLHVVADDRSSLDAVRSRSRADDHRTTVHLVHHLADDSWVAFTELFRSDEIISARDVPGRSEADNALLAKERPRRRELELEALRLLSRDLAAGSLVFDGATAPAPSGTLRQVAEQSVAAYVPRIFPDVAAFAAPVGGKEALTVLRAEPGSRAPRGLGDDGIGLYATQADGDVVVTDRPPLADLLELVAKKVAYGEDASGAWLAAELARPPRGAELDVVRVLAAAAVRAGLLEVSTAGARIADPGDHRLEKVFTTVPGFRQATFSPPPPDVLMDVRAEVADRLGRRTGRKEPLGTDALAAALRAHVGEAAQATARIVAGYRGADVDLPPVVTRTQHLVGDIVTGSAATALTTAHASWGDLVAGVDTVTTLAGHLEDDLGLLRRARRQLDLPPPADPAGRDAVGRIRDLLAAGHVTSHRAELASATDVAATARTAEAAEQLEAGRDRLAVLRDDLRRRHADLDDDVVDEALRPLDAEVPEQASDLPPGGLEALLYRLDRRAGEAGALLANTGPEGAPVTVAISVAALAPDPIATPEQLDGTLAAVRRAVEEHLADGSQVRLR